MADDAPDATKPGDGELESLWRHGDFLKMWASETFSQAGSQISALALPLIAITLLDAGTFEVGVLSAAVMAPILLVSPFAGILLDRRPRRPIMISANIGRALLLLSIPALYWSGHLSVFLLCLIGFGVGSLTAIFDVAYLVYLPSLVDRRQLNEANARFEATYSIAEFAGPGLGGILIQLLTGPGAIVVNAFTHLASALGISSIRRTEQGRAPDLDNSPWFKELREGFSFVMGHRLLRPLVLQSAAFNFFGWGVFTLYPVFATRDLGLSPGVLGLVLSIGSVGGLLGSAIAGWVARRFGAGPAIVGFMAIGSAAFLLIPLAGSGGAIALTLVTFAFFIHNVGIVGYNIPSLTLRLTETPDHLLARATASYRVISNGTLAAGGLFAGWVGTILDPRGAIVVCGVGATVSAVLLLPTAVRTAALPPVNSSESGAL